MLKCNTGSKSLKNPESTRAKDGIAINNHKIKVNQISFIIIHKNVKLT